MKSVLTRFAAIMIAAVVSVTLLVGCKPQEEDEPPVDSSTPTATAVNEDPDDIFSSGPWTLDTMPSLGVALPPALMTVPVNQPSEKPLRFCFLYYMNNTFWNLIESGALAAKSYYKNFNVTIDLVNIGNEITTPNFQAAFDTAVVQNYDGIICAPFLDGTEAIINRGVAKGVPVVTYCGESVAEGVVQDRFVFIGSDSKMNNSLYCDYIVEDSGGEPGKIGLIAAYLGSSSFDAGSIAFKDELDSRMSGWEYIGPYEGMDSADKCYQIAKDILTADPDVKYIKVTGGGASGACKAVKEAGKLGECKVLANDEVPEHLMYLRTGEMGMICSNNPASYVFDVITLLYNHVAADMEPDWENIRRAVEVGAPVTRRLASNSVILTLENVNDYFPED